MADLIGDEFGWRAWRMNITSDRDRRLTHLLFPSPFPLPCSAWFSVSQLLSHKVETSCKGRLVADR
jgi:hypothetical protein